jgi:hypothetical protein
VKFHELLGEGQDENGLPIQLEQFSSLNTPPLENIMKLYEEDVELPVHITEIAKLLTLKLDPSSQTKK